MDAVAQQPDRLGRRALMAVLRGLVIFAVTLAAADARAVDFSHDVVPIPITACPARAIYCGLADFQFGRS